MVLKKKKNVKFSFDRFVPPAVDRDASCFFFGFFFNKNKLISQFYNFLKHHWHDNFVHSFFLLLNLNINEKSIESSNMLS